MKHSNLNSKQQLLFKDNNQKKHKNNQKKKKAQQSINRVSTKTPWHMNCMKKKIIETDSTKNMII